MLFRLPPAKEDWKYFQTCPPSAWMMWHSLFWMTACTGISLNPFYWVPPRTNNTWAQSYVNVQDVYLHCKVIKEEVAALSWRKLRQDSWIDPSAALSVYYHRDERQDEIRDGECWETTEGSRKQSRGTVRDKRCKCILLCIRNRTLDVVL